MTVFDSTASSVTYSSNAWAGRLLIHEWVDSDNYTVCRCTEHTQWTQADIDAGLNKTYDEYIVPTAGTLDARTYNKLPQRVNKITVGLTDLVGQIALEEGYNIGLEGADVTSDIAQFTLADIGVNEPSTNLIAGRRKTSYLTLSAVPGSGLGAFPSCDGLTDSIYLRKLQGAVADDYGNVAFDTDDKSCLRYQRPVTLTDVNPREFEYYTALPDVDPQAAIEVLNDCGPCCDCEYFARTYQGLKRQWFLYQGIADGAEDTRNDHKTNVGRWNDAKACRESRPLSVSLQTEPECKVVHSAIFGNTSKCCLVDVRFRFTFSYFRNGCVMPSPPLLYYDCHRTECDGSPFKNGPEKLQLIGAYPVYELMMDYMDPQSNARVTFRFCFPGCEPSDRVQVRTHMYWSSVLSPTQYPEWPSKSTTCTYPVVTLDEATQTLWENSALGMPCYPKEDPEDPCVPIPLRYDITTKQIPTNPLGLYCAQCYCPPPAGGSQSDALADWTC